MKKLFGVIVFGLSLLSVLSLEANVASPNGGVRVELGGDNGPLMLTVKDSENTVLTEFKLGLVVDGRDIAEKAKRTDLKVEKDQVSKFKWRGVKSQVVAPYTSGVARMESPAGKWALDIRVFNDGVAFRYRLDNGTMIDRETTACILPEKSRVWHKINKPQYEHRYLDSVKSDLTVGFNMQVPVTVKLASGRHLSIAEAGGFFDWPGLSFIVDSEKQLTAFYADNPKGFSMGQKCSPWRVVMTGPGLNELVNCDIVAAVSPEPDPTAFPDGDAPWIRGGRCLWQWWAYSDAGTKWEKQFQMVDAAAELKCHYYLVDAGWENPKYGWCTEMGNAWDSMRQLVDYARSKNVGILAWRAWKDCNQGPGVETHEKLESFMKNCARVGILGVKIDYWGSESQSRRAWINEVHKAAQKYKIMVNLHGCAKPAGEQRTYPFSLTREGVLGLEHNKWGAVSPTHYCHEPFLRCLAGNADFTPTTFQKKSLKGTTSAFQLATAVIYTSPHLTWADKPEVYLASPALPLIKVMPFEYDETRVLPGSAIGKCVVMARRVGKVWWVAAINGDAKKERKINVEIKQFIDDPLQYEMVQVGDPMPFKKDAPEQMSYANLPAVPADGSVALTLAPGGGAVLRIVPKGHVDVMTPVVSGQ